jgi:hypothetical protein
MELGRARLLISFTFELAKIEPTLTAAITDQVLYLPTYRRIERDLRSIFPGLESESGIGDFRERFGRREGTGYVELVEFGMKDVEKTVQRKMSEIKDNVRNGLNSLTGVYLRDVIQGVYRSADLLPGFRDLDETTVNAIFSRIPEAILPQREQRSLRETVDKIQSTGRIDNKDRVVAHFLTQLIELHKTQQEDEKGVREFVRVCNGYLAGQEKELVYDNRNMNSSCIHLQSDFRQCSVRLLSLFREARRWGW